MTTFRNILLGMLLGMAASIGIFIYYEHERKALKLEEVSPGVRREQLEQLPPNSKNVVGLGNGWLQFELEVKGENKIYLYRGGVALPPTK